MERLIARVLSVFSPNDEVLSPETASQIQLHRLLTLVGAALALLFALLYSISQPGAEFLGFAPIGMAGLFVLLFGASYGSWHVRRNYVSWMWGLFYVVMAWSVLITTGNRFAADYSVGLLLAHAVLVVLIGFGARSIQSVLWFSGYSLVITAFGTVVGPSPETSPLILLASMAIVGVTETIVIQRQLSTREKLRTREKRFRTITENVSDGIYRSTRDEGLVYANQALAEMFGYEDVESILQVDPSTLYADPENRSHLRAQLAEQEAFDAVEVEFRKADGSTFPALLSATIFRDEEGEVVYYDGAVTDITEQRQRQREVQKRSNAMEMASDGIAILDSAGTYIYVNQAHAEVYGYDAPEPFLGAPWKVCYDEEELRRFEEEIMPTLLENGEWRGEARGLRADGTSFPQQLSLTILDDGGMICIVRDISEQKETERDLQVRQEKVESLYSATSQLLKTESLGEVADRVHEVLWHVFDYSLTGITFAEGRHSDLDRCTFEETYQLPPIQSLDAENPGVGTRAYRSGETVVVEDVQALDSDVAYGDLRSAAAVPLGDHGAIVLGRVEPGEFPSFDLRLVEILAAHTTVVLDGLEQLKALRESEQRFRRIFENAAVGIAVLDDGGQFLEVNPSLRGMTGYEAGELRGEHFAVITHPDDLATDRQRFEQLVDGGRDRYQMEKRYVRTDGEVFWGRLTVSRHEGSADGQVLGMVEDIDDRKRYEKGLRKAKEEAERMSRLKSAFLANMSHEIRTPLTSIIGFAEAIGDEVESLDGSLEGAEHDTLDRFAALIEQGGKRLMETLDAVLNLSKLEAGEMDLDVAPLDLAGEAQEAAELFERQAEESGINFRVEGTDRPAWGRADEGGLRIALRNLLSNALKYTSEGGQVWLRTRSGRDTIALEVEDTGVGMDPDRVPELFEAFKQESEGMSRQYQGSGLGLAVTKRVVNQMEGTIDVETEKGEGTCFTIRLPRVEERFPVGRSNE